LEHAFILLAYRAPEQVARLCRRLTEAGSAVFVHFDARSGERPKRQLQAALEGITPVHLLPSVPTPWGSFGIVTATLAGVEAALADERGFTHFTSVSGQDYPIRPVEEFNRFLEEHEGRSFIPHFRLGPGPWEAGGGIGRLDRWYFRPGNARLHVPNKFFPFPPRRRPPDGIEPFGGTAHWTLTRACAERAVDVARRPDVRRYFRYAFIPDELYFQSVLASSPLAGTLVNEDLRYAYWVRGIPHPRLLEVADLPRLAESGAFIARKFDAEGDAGLLDAIDRDLLGIPVR
jgi:hypothetical protein